MQLSPQQQAVIEWTAKGIGSAFIEAVAGAGKTTTLLELLAYTLGSVAFAAYNKKIADEIKAKLADRADPDSEYYDERFVGIMQRVRVGTFHSFGFSAWRRIHPGVKVDDNAKYKQTVEQLRSMEMKQPGSAPENLHGFIMKLVSLAKQRAIGLNGAIDDDSLWYDIVDHFDLAYEIENEEQIQLGIQLAQRCLRYHIALSPKLIDFDDMIYMPLVSGCRMWENDWVLVDEAQDTNPARRALARKMLRKGGRAGFVGDRHQAIYGFTGADGDAIERIIRDFRCTTLPLTVTYRCPKSVVELAQTIVSHIQAHGSAPNGIVREIHIDELLKGCAHGQGCDSQGCNHNLDTCPFYLKPTDAILCRNTKPLVTLAFDLIRRNIPCHVEGKDIGAGLLKLVNRFKATDLNELHTKMEDYRDEQSQKLIAKGKENQAEALIDRVETIFVIAGNCHSVSELREKIISMFTDSADQRKPMLTLSTVHKSKGREWQRVFCLGENMYMPSRWARKDWQIQQEDNLIYVMYTRAQSELIRVTVNE